MASPPLGQNMRARRADDARQEPTPLLCPAMPENTPLYAPPPTTTPEAPGDRGTARFAGDRKMAAGISWRGVLPLLSFVFSCVLPVGQWCLAAPPEPLSILDSGVRPEEVGRRSYLSYVRECVEVLMRQGTDRYGKVRSPMLMNIIDVRTRECPAGPLPLDEGYRVIRRGRRGPGGGNLYAELPTMAALIRLARVTGDDRYRRFAAESSNYTMSNLIDEKGFFWWGWHRHYDAYRDVMTGHAGSPHEIHIQRVDWPFLWQVNPRAVRREVEAIWQWHVIDKQTGEVNRHGDGKRGCDFAMSAGEMIGAFAFLYNKTNDPTWLGRARLLADYYWQRRHEQTNLIANRPNAGTERFDGSHFDTSIAAFLCRGLLDAYEYSGAPLFREHALAYLTAYARYGYDERTGKFWGCLRLDGTPEPGPRVVGGYAQYEPRGHIDLWQPYAAGYEHPIHTALAYVRAAEMTGSKELTRAAVRWAEFIQAGLPPAGCLAETWYREYAERWAPHGTYAGKYGRTISFFCRMQRLRGDERYGQVARQVAADAVSRLHYKGLFRGHPAKPYYESIDDVGDLLVGLLELDELTADQASVTRNEPE
ncbi:MAG TPA: hypothetical protein EYH34_07595 [Planctomycetes bacterium]|nr:hypothetical protein [Planctomycetota bacterium]